MKAIWYHHFEKNKEYGYIETIGTRIQTVYITKLHIISTRRIGKQISEHSFNSWMISCPYRVQKMSPSLNASGGLRDCHQA